MSEPASSPLPVLHLARPEDRAAFASRLARLTLGIDLDAHAPSDDLSHGSSDASETPAVRRTLADVRRRGDDALIDAVRAFDDPAFDASRLRVDPADMSAALARVEIGLRRALERSICQVEQYQRHILPSLDPRPLEREGVTLSLRHTPVDSAGLYVPGGKASYPSSLIMLAVPARVAGVRRIVVCTPATPLAKAASADPLLAACAMLGLTDVFRVGGAAAIAAMAFGTATVPAVDKIVGPGNRYVQTAKRLVSGAVGVDGYLGPSEIVVVSDGSTSPAIVAADLLAQAEHDPGSCFLVTTDAAHAEAVGRAIGEQSRTLGRAEAIRRSLARDSVAIVAAGEREAADVANRLAGEHVSLLVRDTDRWLAMLRHGGCVFVGPYSPVAAGDYLAGPSHCLPTNTTARFSGGISVFEFLKRSGVVRYDRAGLHADASAIVTLATAEGLDAHAASVTVRLADDSASAVPAIGPASPPCVRQAVRRMAGYTPGEQPSSVQHVVKLNTNENPYPPSPRAMEAIRSIDPDALRRYPDPTAGRFRRAAAGVLGVSADQILAGNGSDDLLTIATRTFVPPGGRIAVCEPTYSLYPVLAALQDASLMAVPWGDGWSLPVEALASCCADAIYVPNPNAPSGTFVPPAAFSDLASQCAGVLLIDEAYADFAGEDCLSLASGLPNVVVTRSLSKGYGMAGVRFGYAVASEDVIAQMAKVKDSYNCDAVAIAAATAAIEDQAYARGVWEKVAAERERLSTELTRLDFDVLPSRANFVLATSPEGSSAGALYRGLKERGVLVRWFDEQGLRERLRITVGTPGQTDCLLSELRALLG